MEVRNRKMKLKGGASAFVLLTLLTAASAQAQTPVTQGQSGDENARVVDEIIVTGLKNTVRSIGETKASADGVLDTITNAEIELVSDFTLAEAATRIPGVFGVAFNSQPRFLSLRGFDARYNSTDLDGNPIWNSSENNRGTQLDILPSSAVNQIDVIKSLTPDVDANSIGGHISVRTLRAFDGGTDPYVKARAEYGFFDQDNGDANYRLDAVGKTTFGDQKQYGIVVGADLQKRNFKQDTFRLGDGLQIFTNTDGVDVEIPARGTWRFENQNIQEKNSSIFAKLEARETDNLYAFATVNYFQVEDAVDADRRRAFVDTRTDRVLSAEQGVGEAARGTDAYQVSDFTRDIGTLLLAGGVDYRVGDLSTVKARASWTSVDLEEDFFSSGRFEDVTRTGNRTPRTFDITGDFGVFDHDRTIGTNPLDFTYRSSTFEEDTKLKDDLYSLRLDFDHNTFAQSEGFGLRTGASWRRLDRDHDRTVRQASLNSGVSYTFADNQPGITEVDFFDTSIAIDRTQLRQFLNSNTTVFSDDVGNLGADYKLQEDVLSAYVMGTYATEKARLIGGLRYEHTSLDDDIFTVTDGVVAPDKFSNNYNNLLPYAHLSYDVAPNVTLRAAYTETIGRPDFEAFAFGSQVSTDGLSMTTVSGNRDLGPRKAKNYDLSAEYYFDDLDGYFALGLFSKSLTNEHFSQTTIVPNAADPLGEAIFRTTTFSDNGEANVDGFEASLVMKSFDFLPGLLSNFGVIANYTYLDGEYNVVLDDGTRRTIDSLRNQPGELFNLTGTYTQGRVTAALAYNYSGEAFSGDFESRPASADVPELNDEFIAPFDTLDAKLAVDLTDNITATFAAKNITDSVYTTKTGQNRSLAKRATQFGSSYFVGLKVKY